MGQNKHHDSPEEDLSADTRAETQKRQWLVQQVKDSPACLTDTQAHNLIAAFAELTPPLVPEVVQKPEVLIGYITVFPSSSQGTSRKPGNLTLNWRRLFELIPDTSLASLGAATAPAAIQPWAIALAGLYVWNKVGNGMKQDLTEVEACIMQALWSKRRDDKRVAETDGLQHTNALRVIHGKAPLALQTYSDALTRLARIHCIELDDGVILLCESVRIKYT